MTLRNNPTRFPPPSRATPSSPPTYIRRTIRGASKDHGASRPTLAAAVDRVHEESAALVTNQLTTLTPHKDVEMSDHYNKQSASPPTTTNSISALARLKRTKSVSTKSGHTNSKAAQGRSRAPHSNSNFEMQQLHHINQDGARLIHSNKQKQQHMHHLPKS